MLNDTKQNITRVLVYSSPLHCMDVEATRKVGNVPDEQTF